MSDLGEAAEAIVGLVIGGIIFIIFGSALAGTALGGDSLMNFEFWGVLYILVALVLAVVVVAGVITSLLDGL